MPRCLSPVLLCALLVAGFAAPARAEVTAVVGVDSNPSRSGLAEADDLPALVGTLEYALSEQHYLGVSGYAGGREPGAIRDRGVSLYAGTQQRLGRSLVLGASLEALRYPDDVVDWGFEQGEVRLGLEGRGSVGIAFAPDYYNVGVAATTFDLSLRRDFSDGRFATVQTGWVAFGGGRFEDYGFARFDLGLSIDAFTARLGYQVTSNRRGSLFASDVRDARVLGALTWTLR